jgi:hypothetical protein
MAKPHRPAARVLAIAAQDRAIIATTVPLPDRRD